MEILKYIQSLLNQELVYGINDCHILALTIIDIQLETNYRDIYYGKYHDPKSGWLYSKNTEYPTLRDLLNTVGTTKQSIPNNGCVLLKGNHASTYWNGKVLVLNNTNNKYELTHFCSSDEWEIYYIGK
ncbi:hypothetical protein [Candidatus Symbiopectobacterium sp. NZEC135]|uniref:hypothetical protein n=1 Tax=Candidatus Symbiopectobacterium sp. NZEC135 TaxID=2820471 RepID=UPI002226B699|nr:hypothetical protein [Candidatus Symbiopectobacterium sp. NZEC135]MCW2478115.1 hypothetical protein [Candidatus Symbiopectobacterium sp. NZEC135]